MELHVLGSGGPIARPDGISSAYLVIGDEEPAMLVDAGGGVIERIGRLGIEPSAIGTVLLTHTHIDHTRTGARDLLLRHGGPRCAHQGGGARRSR